jgi:GTP cyclohydrolase II
VRSFLTRFRSFASHTAPHLRRPSASDLAAQGKLDQHREVKVRDAVEIPLGPRADMARFHSFDNIEGEREHLLVSFGIPGFSDVPRHLDAPGRPGPLVRIHSECLTGDLFGSLRCDCGQQLAGVIDLLAREGGYLVYLRQEGRGIGLYRKLTAYRLQDQGLDTFEANRHLGLDDDLRDYGVAAAMLRAVGVGEVRLITNSPDKLEQLEENGIRVQERIPTPLYLTPYNRNYLAAKVEHARHCLQVF